MNLSDLDTDDFTAFGNGASVTAYSSPGLPSVFDFGTANSSTANMATVSPQDLLLPENPFMSAPNSAALTTLTSPSIYDASPDFGDGYDVSPDFGSNDYVSGGNPGEWFTLFPETLPKAENVKDSPATHSEELESAARKPATSGHRRKSSHSPPSGRHSSISGVNPRRRDKPLPPIVVDDPSDTVAMKRARNTLAARKSRERKAQRVEELEEMIEKLEAERDHWKAMALGAGAKE